MTDHILKQGFGYNTVDTQMFTVIVYACSCIGILFWARIADRTNARGLTLAASTCGGIVGYAMLVAIDDERARFAATCIVGFSIYPSIVLQLSWSAMCFAGYTRRYAEYLPIVISQNTKQSWSGVLL